MGDGDVTGGDLYSLWQVANVYLPTVSNVYTDSSSAIGESDGQGSSAFDTGNEGHHGTTVRSPIYPAYYKVRGELQHILAQTATNLIDCSTVLNQAIEDYIAEDEANGGDLGDTYETILDGGKVDGVQLHDPNDPSTNPPTGEDKPGKPDEPDIHHSPGDEKAENPEQEQQDLEDIKEDIEDMKNE